MLDASKYAEHFPTEIEPAATAQAKLASAPHTVAPSPSLLAALYQLEKEFSEILRAQQSESTDRPE